MKIKPILICIFGFSATVPTSLAGGIVLGAVDVNHQLSAGTNLENVREYAYTSAEGIIFATNAELMQRGAPDGVGTAIALLPAAGYELGMRLTVAANEPR